MPSAQLKHFEPLPTAPVAQATGLDKASTPSASTFCKGFTAVQPPCGSAWQAASPLSFMGYPDRQKVYRRVSGLGAGITSKRRVRAPQWPQVRFFWVLNGGCQSVVAVGVMLKAVDNTFLLKKANKEIDRLWSEIEACKQDKDEAITRIKESAVAREGELSHRIMELEEALKHADPVYARRILNA